MNRIEVLDKAKAIVEGKREEYPENSFAVTAEMWNWYLAQKYAKSNSGMALTADDVAMMMALLKVVRIAGGHYKADSYIDLIGYASWAAELADVE